MSRDRSSNGPPRTGSRVPVWLWALAVASSFWTGPTPVLAEADAKPEVKTLAAEDHPGFFDFALLDMFSGDNLEIHISIKGPLLQLVAAASDEPDLSSILKRLSGVEVRVYSLNESKRLQAREALDDLASRLKKEQWVPAITVQVQRDHGYAFLRYQEGSDDPVGLAAMYLTEENQAVFVNIVGSMNTATIGRLARRFDLDLLAVEEPE